MGIFGKGPETKPAESPAAPRPAAPGSQPAKSTTCLIGAKTVLKGELSGDEDVVIEGSVEGQIRIAKDVHVATGGIVKATVTAHSIVVSGELTGDCHASHKVEIQATGRMTGNIRAPKIVIAEGALFKGNSDMSARKEERKDQIAVS
jgi:cytoskeletal protein CcmA (bactofilin family)